MKLKNIAFLLSLLLTASPVSIKAFAVESSAVQTAEESETYTVNFVDFDGKVIDTQKLKSGEAIDYSRPDTDSLKCNVDPFTQRKFYTWDIHPETVSENTTIHALYTEAVISLDALPSKTVYSLNDTNIDPSGLKVIITMSSQTPDFDDNGNRIMNVSKTDISSTCTLSPNNVKDAFADSDSAEIQIYPIASSTPVGSYTVTLDFLRGDVNFDGVINASDASEIIRHYAACSIGVDDGFTAIQKRAADFNCDGVINASDSSDVLIYYADISSGN